MFAATAADAASIAYPVGGAAIFITMLKMIWTVYTNGTKGETALRKSFTEERSTRELEFTADFARQKAEYSESLIRHQQIHALEIAAFQSRITNYIEELTGTKARVSVLEAEVKDLRTEVKELRTT
jgi:hypothetical protein